MNVWHVEIRRWLGMGIFRSYELSLWWYTTGFVVFTALWLYANLEMRLARERYKALEMRLEALLAQRIQNLLEELVPHMPAKKKTKRLHKDIQSVKESDIIDEDVLVAQEAAKAKKGE